MPYRAPTACTQPGCRAVTYRSHRCLDHQPPPRPSPYKQGYDHAWQKTRIEHLSIEPQCRNCGRVANEVDHIIPKRQRGSNDHSNLQSLCKPCHSRKTGRGE